MIVAFSPPLVCVCDSLRNITNFLKIGNRMGRFVTSADVRRFAREFQEVCEGHPAENYPVLLREHLLQRCRVASLGRSTVKSAQLICRELCMAMLAFQTPLVGMLDGTELVKHVLPGETRDRLVACVGNEEALAKATLLVFNDRFGEMNWYYVDTLTDAEILLVGTTDASEMMAMLMALTFSECGRRKNTVMYRGRRKTPKTKILFSPPLGPVDDPSSWTYNTADDEHFWVGGTKQLVSIDGACFEYMPGRTSVYMWSGDHGAYEVVGAQPCNEALAAKMLDRLKDMLGTVEFDIMTSWSTTTVDV